MQPTSDQSPLNQMAFYALAESLDSIIFVKDKNGRFTFMNKAGSRLLRLNPSEVIGKDETDLFGPSVGFESWETEHLVIASGQPVTYTMNWVINGISHTLKTTKQPITNQDGETLGIIGFSQIVSEDTEIQPKRQLTQPFTEKATKDIPQKSVPGKPVQDQSIKPLVQPNPEVYSSLSRSLLSLQSAMIAVASSLDLKHIYETLTWELINLLHVQNCIVFKWDQANKSVKTQSVYQADSTIQYEKTYKLDEFPLFIRVIDECRPAQYTTDQLEPTLKEYGFMTSIGIRSLLLLPMVFQEQVVGLVGLIEYEEPRVFTDWEISLALLLANQTASSIVNARLYDQLGAANEALKASNEELDAFAHTVSHDLKSPLSRMLGFSEFILEESDRLSKADLSEFLNIIAQNSRKMNDIINGLLMLASVRQEDIESEIVDMMSYLNEAMSRLTFQFEDYEIEFKIPENLPSAWGYGPWIEEVWINYLSNAIKYGGRPPQVEVGATAQENNMIRYWVKDNGQGLTLEQQAQLFTPFTRLNQVNIEGHGLGLSIVRRIVKKFGGEVGIESEIGQGSRFFFTLPGIVNDLKAGNSM